MHLFWNYSIIFKVVVTDLNQVNVVFGNDISHMQEKLYLLLCKSCTE